MRCLVSLLLKFIDLIDKINDQVGKLISFLVIFMIIVMAYEVIARYFFNSPTIWARETVMFLLGGYALLGGAYVLRHEAHVNMDILYQRLSPKRRAILSLITYLLLFLFLAVLLWKGSEYAWRSIGLHETTDSDWGPPEYIIKTIIPIGAFLLLLQGFAQFIRNMITAITGAKPK